MAGYPSEKDFKNMVSSRLIPNCPVTIDYIKNYNTIFGLNVPSLKRKMLRRKTKPVVSNYITIPKEILKLHKMAVVEADIIFVNWMAFLVSISIYVNFATVKYIGKSTMGNIYKYLLKINDVYYRSGMYVETFYMDWEFENIKIIIPGR